MTYLWLKAFHLILIVAWFAGLFYIFRLFVYHVKFKDQENMAQAYNLMQRKLLHIIMHPAMVLTLLSGFLLVGQNPSVLMAEWFYAKLLGVFVLLAYHFLAVITHERFSHGDYWLSERACRMINEIPTICLFLIIIMVVVKPF